MIRALAFAAGAFAFTACGSNGGGAGPCEANPDLPECLQTCDPQPGAANTCAAGYHCAPDGTCDAQCTQGGGECGTGRTCTADGTCVDDGIDAQTGPDADCPDVMFTAQQVIPTVQLLLDKSGSMDDGYAGGDTKWEALDNALVGSTDIIGNYQASVYFGATLYSEQDGSCPDLAPSAAGTGRALNNRTAIADLIDANGPGGGTPTYESLDATYMEMVANPGPADSPPIIILATDGDPFLCPDNDQNTLDEARANVVATAQAAYTAGIRVFVLGLSVNDETDAHLRQVANAGVGEDPVTGTATYYPADNPTALADAFDAIIGGVASCDLTLDGDITSGQAAAGTVLLNGMPLTYGTDWTLVGTNVIHLEAGACMTLQSTTNPTVTGTFPCGSIIE